MKRDVIWNVDIQKLINTNMRGNLQFYATIFSIHKIFENPQVLWKPKISFNEFGCKYGFPAAFYVVSNTP